MKFRKALIACFTCLALTAFVLPDFADAARIGGGRSFGSAPRMMTPAPKAPAGSTMQQPSAINRQAAPGAAAAAASRPGMFGGLFGGLLAGSLLGSLLMGHGFAGGGLLDILLIGLLVFFALRFFRSRMANRSENYQRPSYQERPQQNSAWSNLSSQPQRASMANAPADFDEAEFLRGAKMAYSRLQEAWDRRDLEDIAQFATPALMEELRRQKEEDPTPSTTEILLVNASLREVENEGIFQRAAVQFDVVMREDQRKQDTEEVSEVWHFVRNAQTKESWRLDGIQQVK